MQVMANRLDSERGNSYRLMDVQMDICDCKVVFVTEKSVKIGLKVVEKNQNVRDAFKTSQNGLKVAKAGHNQARRHQSINPWGWPLWPPTV